MFDSNTLAETRARVLAAGLSPQDLTWIDSLNWNDAAVPPVQNDPQYDKYRQMEKCLNDAVAPLTFPERAQSPEGKFAAALGARIADWRDQVNGAPQDQEDD